METDLKCRTCGGTASLEVWEEHGKTVAYVECTCGMITAMKSSSNGDKMIAGIIKKYNKNERRVLNKKTRLKSCFCGSTKISLEKFENSCYIMCYECLRTTEEGNSDGSYKTLDQAIELWNKEIE
jgi:hypothetical protein